MTALAIVIGFIVVGGAALFFGIQAFGYMSLLVQSFRFRRMLEKTDGPSRSRKQ